MHRKRIIIAIFLDWRQPNRLRRVANTEHQIDRADHRDRARYVKSILPAAEMADGPGHEYSHGAGTKVVRRVPNAERKTALFFAEPVTHDAPARRPAHSLGEAVERPQAQMRVVIP